MGGFQDYYGQTSIHPLAVVAVAILGIWALRARREYALMPLFVAATAGPMAQRLVVFGADFTLLRILLVVYLVRILASKEERQLAWSRVDTWIVLWTLAGIVIMVIHQSSAVLVNRLGNAYDILVTYFAARCLIRDWNAVRSHAKAISIVAIPVAFVFMIEWMTRYNLFSIFGGVPEVTVMREGRLRCQGAFAHPILAGTFWTACVPVILTRWKGEPSRKLCIAGIVAAFIIIIACSSSTPILSLGITAIGLGLFRYRKYRTQMWIGLLAMLVLLHLVMSQPVWHLLARLDVLGGSTGWHRFVILNAFIENFGSWWVSGASTAEVTEWGVWEMRDITNHYVAQGLEGGLITLAAFIFLFVSVFSAIGKSLAASAERSDVVEEWQYWAFGAAMVAHMVTFLAVSYFGQMTTILYIQLAVIGSLSVRPPVAAPRKVMRSPAHSRPGRYAR